MKNNILLLSIALLVMLVSCKKDEPTPAKESSPKAALYEKAWKVIKVTNTDQNSVLYQDPLPAGSTNAEDYSRYQITFSAAGYALIDRTGATTTGTWEETRDGIGVVLDKGVAGKETLLYVHDINSTYLNYNYTENSTGTGSRKLTVELTPVAR
ncbi:MAG: hypothetical protein ICV83_20685 [Cytophagales bacterium]|nr:hypothetical protein [Cytophagales bacterium]